MKNNGKVRDVRSLVCKIKVLNGRVPGTWKWTIAWSPKARHRTCWLTFHKWCHNQMALLIVAILWRHNIMTLKCHMTWIWRKVNWARTSSCFKICYFYDTPSLFCEKSLTWISFYINPPLSFNSCGVVSLIHNTDQHCKYSICHEKSFNSFCTILYKVFSFLQVIHSCSGDSAALFFQFDVKLRNVFDTQVHVHQQYLKPHLFHKLSRLIMKIKGKCSFSRSKKIFLEIKVFRT